MRQAVEALAADGEAPVETFLRLADAADGQVMFTLRVFNPSLEALETFLGSEFVLPSLGDTGAHVGQIMDAGRTSFVLSRGVRDAHLYTPGEAIRRMTDRPGSSGYAAAVRTGTASIAGGLVSNVCLILGVAGADSL